MPREKGRRRNTLSNDIASEIQAGSKALTEGHKQLTIIQT